MSGPAGRWAIACETPIGPVRATLTVVPDGDGGFTGDLASEQGTVAADDGRIEGDALRWTVKMVKPLSVRLDCTATIAGDALSGRIKACWFGSYDLTGTRIG